MRRKHDVAGAAAAAAGAALVAAAVVTALTKHVPSGSPGSLSILCLF